MSWADSEKHKRTMARVAPSSRRRCPFCPVPPVAKAHRATHVGLANGLAMTTACEWWIRQWVRSGAITFMQARRVRAQRTT